MKKRKERASPPVSELSLLSQVFDVLRSSLDRDRLIKEVLKWRYGVYGGRAQPASVRDIGRDWMVENGLRKAGSKAWFTTWEEGA